MKRKKFIKCLVAFVMTLVMIAGVCLPAAAMSISSPDSTNPDTLAWELSYENGKIVVRINPETVYNIIKDRQVTPEELKALIPPEILEAAEAGRELTPDDLASLVSNYVTVDELKAMVNDIPRELIAEYIDVERLTELVDIQEILNLLPLDEIVSAVSEDSLKALLTDKAAEYMFTNHSDLVDEIVEKVVDAEFIDGMVANGLFGDSAITDSIKASLSADDIRKLLDTNVITLEAAKAFSDSELRELFTVDMFKTLMASPTFVDGLSAQGEILDKLVDDDFATGFAQLEWGAYANLFDPQTLTKDSLKAQMQSDPNVIDAIKNTAAAQSFIAEELCGNDSISMSELTDIFSNNDFDLIKAQIDANKVLSLFATGDSFARVYAKISDKAAFVDALSGGTLEKIIITVGIPKVLEYASFKSMLEDLGGPAELIKFYTPQELAQIAKQIGTDNVRDFVQNSGVLDAIDIKKIATDFIEYLRSKTDTFKALLKDAAYTTIRIFNSKIDTIEYVNATATQTIFASGGFDVNALLASILATVPDLESFKNLGAGDTILAAVIRLNLRDGVSTKNTYEYGFEVKFVDGVSPENLQDLVVGFVDEFDLDVSYDGTIGDPASQIVFAQLKLGLPSAVSAIYETLLTSEKIPVDIRQSLLLLPNMTPAEAAETLRDILAKDIIFETISEKIDLIKQKAYEKIPANEQLDKAKAKIDELLNKLVTREKYDALTGKAVSAIEALGDKLLDGEKLVSLYKGNGTISFETLFQVDFWEVINKVVTLPDMIKALFHNNTLIKTNLGANVTVTGMHSLTLIGKDGEEFVTLLPDGISLDVFEGTEISGVIDINDSYEKVSIDKMPAEDATYSTANRPYVQFVLPDNGGFAYAQFYAVGDTVEAPDLAELGYTDSEDGKYYYAWEEYTLDGNQVVVATERIKHKNASVTFVGNYSNSGDCPTTGECTVPGHKHNLAAEEWLLKDVDKEGALLARAEELFNSDIDAYDNKRNYTVVAESLKQSWNAEHTVLTVTIDVTYDPLVEITFDGIYPDEGDQPCENDGHKHNKTLTLRYSEINDEVLLKKAAILNSDADTPLTETAYAAQSIAENGLLWSDYDTKLAVKVNMIPDPKVTITFVSKYEGCTGGESCTDPLLHNHNTYTEAARRSHIENGTFDLSEIAVQFNSNDEKYGKLTYTADIEKLQKEWNGDKTALTVTVNMLYDPLVTITFVSAYGNCTDGTCNDPLHNHQIYKPDTRLSLIDTFDFNEYALKFESAIEADEVRTYTVKSISKGDITDNTMTVTVTMDYNPLVTITFKATYENCKPTDCDNPEHTHTATVTKRDHDITPANLLAWAQGEFDKTFTKDDGNVYSYIVSKAEGTHTSGNKTLTVAVTVDYKPAITVKFNISGTDTFRDKTDTLTAEHTNVFAHNHFSEGDLNQLLEDYIKNAPQLNGKVSTTNVYRWQYKEIITIDEVYDNTVLCGYTVSVEFERIYQTIVFPLQRQAMARMMLRNAQNGKTLTVEVPWGASKDDIVAEATKKLEETYNGGYTFPDGAFANFNYNSDGEYAESVQAVTIPIEPEEIKLSFVSKINHTNGNSTSDKDLSEITTYVFDFENPSWTKDNLLSVIQGNLDFAVDGYEIVDIDGFDASTYPDEGKLQVTVVYTPKQVSVVFKAEFEGCDGQVELNEIQIDDFYDVVTYDYIQGYLFSTTDGKAPQRMGYTLLTSVEFTQSYDNNTVGGVYTVVIKYTAKTVNFDFDYDFSNDSRDTGEVNDTWTTAPKYYEIYKVVISDLSGKSDTINTDNGSALATHVAENHNDMDGYELDKFESVADTDDKTNVKVTVYYKAKAITIVFKNANGNEITKIQGEFFEGNYKENSHIKTYVDANDNYNASGNGVFYKKGYKVSELSQIDLTKYAAEYAVTVKYAFRDDIKVVFSKPTFNDVANENIEFNITYAETVDETYLGNYDIFFNRTGYSAFINNITVSEFNEETSTFTVTGVKYTGKLYVIKWVSNKDGTETVVKEAQWQFGKSTANAADTKFAHPTDLNSVEDFIGWDRDITETLFQNAENDILNNGGDGVITITAQWDTPVTPPSKVTITIDFTGADGLAPIDDKFKSMEFDSDATQEDMEKAIKALDIPWYTVGKVSVDTSSGKAEVSLSLATYTAEIYADGQKLGEWNYSWGDSVPFAITYPIPEKAGFVGSWPTDYTLEPYSMKIEAVYTPIGSTGIDSNTGDGTQGTSDTSTDTDKQEPSVVKTWIIWIIILIVLVLLAAGIIAFFLLRPKDDDDDDDNEPDAAPVPEPEPEAPVEEAEPIVVDKVGADEADSLMTDATAAALVGKSDKVERGKRAIVNISAINAAFEDGDTVDLAALKQKKLVPANAGRVKILADGTLDKALHIEASAFSVQAIKMITLTGGTVTQTASE